MSISDYNSNNIAELKLKEAHKLQQEGKLEEAIDYYKSLISIDPNLSLAHHSLADTFQKIGNIEASILHYRKALEINPKYAWSHNNLGSALMKQGNLEESILCYQKAIDLNKNCALYYEMLGDAFKQKNDFEAANATYRNALKLNSDKIEIYQKLAECDFKEPEFYFEIAVELAKRNCFKQSIECFIKSIDLKPDFISSYFHLLGYQRQGKFSDKDLDKLIECYRTAIQRQPKFDFAYLTLGSALIKRGLINEAIFWNQKGVLQKTLNSQPNLYKNCQNIVKTEEPSFLIIGVPKSGTSSLYDYIIQHPQVLGALQKELDFFSPANFSYGIKWYLSNFPVVPEKPKFLTGEATPLYLYQTGVDEQIYSLFPNIKLIVILRNPVQRAISDHYHRVRMQANPSSFEDVYTSQMLEQFRQMENPNVNDENYLRRRPDVLWKGLYVYFIQKWMRLFSRNQILVLSAESLFTNPVTTMKKTFEFLELPDHQLSDYQKHNAGSYHPIETSLYQELSDIYKPHNHKLEDYLNQKFDWI